MSMADILLNDAEPFEQIDNTLSTDSPMSNLVKTGQAIPGKKTFKDYKIVNMYIAQEQVQITRGSKL